MTREELQKLSLSLSALGVFAGLLQKPLFTHFLSMTEAQSDSAALRACGALIHEIYEKGGNFAAFFVAY